jgi:hypothetical protein
VETPVGTAEETTGSSIQSQPPTPTAEVGDRFITEITTDAQGNFILRGLEPGTYFIVIGDETVELSIRESAEPYTLVVPLATGESVTFLVEGISRGGTLLPTNTPVTPGVGGAETETPTPEVTSTMPTTGLFDGEDDDVTGTDLLILLLAGGVLMGVVVTARRLRST